MPARFSASATLLLGVFMARHVIAGPSACQEGVHKELWVLSAHAPAASFCATHYPQPAATVTVADFPTVAAASSLPGASNVSAGSQLSGASNVVGAAPKAKVTVTVYTCSEPSLTPRSEELSGAFVKLQGLSAADCKAVCYCIQAPVTVTKTQTIAPLKTLIAGPGGNTNTHIHALNNATSPAAPSTAASVTRPADTTIRPTASGLTTVITSVNRTSAQIPSSTPATLYSSTLSTSASASFVTSTLETSATSTAEISSTTASYELTSITISVESTFTAAPEETAVMTIYDAPITTALPEVPTSTIIPDAPISTVGEAPITTGAPEEPASTVSPDAPVTTVFPVDPVSTFIPDAPITTIIPEAPTSTVIDIPVITSPPVAEPTPACLAPGTSCTVDDLSILSTLGSGCCGDTICGIAYMAGVQGSCMTCSPSTHVCSKDSDCCGSSKCGGIGAGGDWQWAYCT